MDGAEVLRAVRRRQGWSQRELARRAGVSDRTISAVEAGRRRPTLAVLEAVVDAGGLDLALDLPLPELPPAVRAHLRLSLSERLHRSLGGRGRPRGGNNAEKWNQLQQLATSGRVILHGQAALGLWLPQLESVSPVELCFQQTQPGTREPGADLALVQECEGHAAAAVSVSLGSWVVGVDPPAELALQPSAAVHRQELRAVARLLHDVAATDTAGRRRAAHRDPAHLEERAYVFHTKRFRPLPMPDETDTRGWRLGDDASLAGWLSRYGFPV